MKRNDFEFRGAQLKIMPLDSEKKFLRSEWIKKHQDKSSWNSVEIPGIHLSSFVGSGANGIVLEAVENISKRKCAVKIWMPHKRSKNYNVFFKKYQEEVEKLAVLKDPAIVTAYTASVTTNGYYYSTIEWVDGVTLKEFLNRQKPLRHQMRYPILKAILNSIIQCHSIGTFHGDLHSENILIETPSDYYADYNVKLLDFGTSLLNRESRPEYNKQRESALLLETALKLLNEEVKHKLLKFKFYSASNTNRVKIQDENDVRNYHPILVSTTLKALNDLYHIIESNNHHVNDEVILDLLRLLLNSTGIDLDNFLNYLIKKIDQNNTDLLRTVPMLLNSQIQNHLFEAGKNSNREYELMLCYYDLLKSSTSRSDVNKTYSDDFEDFDEENFDYYQILNLNSLEEVSNWIYAAKQTLDQKDFMRFNENLFLALGKKFLESYKDIQPLARDYKLIIKLNELKLTSTELPLIVEHITN
ncbi:protein kinase domain-containing protein [Priestia megaterium]|uniref:protein kinase domain-containing protein n=1 Tax=Priestia megaterium TaxID=1404 RepID=UPI002452A4DC|nr:protein kinase [Priestia megaterium]MDH3140452.1 protein kinase [Priestia megaterium]